MKKLIFIFALGACSHDFLYEDTTITQNQPVALYHYDAQGQRHTKLMETPECVGEIMPGMQGNQPGNDFDYRLGCQMQRQMLAQIADPNHALGVAGLSQGQTSGTRAASIINARDSSPDPAGFVPGYILSDIGGTSE